MAKRNTPLEGVSVVTAVSGKPKRTKKPKPLPVEFTLTLKQSNFVDEYIDNGGNATRAYIFAYKVGYGSAAALSSLLLKNINILEVIEMRRERSAAKLNYTREKHLKILVAIATAKKSDYLNIDRDNAEQLATLGYDEYGLQCNSWDQKAARDELRQIYGFDKRSDTGDSDTHDRGLCESARKIKEGRENK